MYPWTTDDTAICVNDAAVVRHVAKPPLKKGMSYPVKGVSIRPCCSRMLLDVGFTTGIEKKFDVCVCGAILEITGNTWWFYADRFRPQVVIEATNEQADQKPLEATPL